MEEATVYEAAGGDSAFALLVEAFYRGVEGDPLLRPMYPEDLEGARERLFLFLTQFFGGPRRYEEQRGHPRLRMRHAPFAIDQAARDRWLELMQASMREQQVPAHVADYLSAFFGGIATFLINRPG